MGEAEIFIQDSNAEKGDIKETRKQDSCGILLERSLWVRPSAKI
jgi:hypothetical protein